MKIYIICVLVVIIFIMIAIRRSKQTEKSFNEDLFDNYKMAPVVKLPIILLAILNLAHVLNVSWGWFIIFLI